MFGNPSLVCFLVRIGRIDEISMERYERLEVHKMIQSCLSDVDLAFNDFLQLLVLLQELSDSLITVIKSLVLLDSRPDEVLDHGARSSG